MQRLLSASAVANAFTWFPNPILVFFPEDAELKILDDQSLPSSLSSSVKMRLKKHLIKYKESMKNMVWSQQVPLHMLYKNKALMPAGTSR